MGNVYEIFNALLINTNDDSLGLYRLPYIVFNYAEAACWFICAGMVIVRYVKLKKSKMEILYGLSFFAFSLTDVMETCGTTLLLLMLKGVCILALLAFRKLALQVHVGSKF